MIRELVICSIEQNNAKQAFTEECPYSSILPDEVTTVQLSCQVDVPQGAVWSLAFHASDAESQDHIRSKISLARLFYHLGHEMPWGEIEWDRPDHIPEPDWP